MLESKNTGSAQTNPNYQTLLAFKPRQVLLAERSAKVTTMKQCSSKTLTLNPDQKALLLQSVLGYLQSNGFSKALKRLLSDAQIETDNWKTCSLNLEDMYGNYLETCICANTNLDTYKDQGLLTDGSTKKSGDSHTSVIEQTVGNKKKKKSNKGDNNAVEICSENGIAESSKNSMEVLVKDSFGDANVELKEKKKSKKVSDSVQQTEQVSTQALHESTADTVSELQIDASTKKQKDKRKKKSNTISESGDANIERVPLDTLQVVNEENFCIAKPSLGEGKIYSESEVKSKKKSNDDNKVDSEAEGKPKDKKKKNKRTTDSLIENVQQHNSALDNMHDVTLEAKKVESKEKKRKKDSSDTLSGDVPDKEDLMTRESKEEPFRTLEGAIDKEKKSSKKRKRLVSEENEVLPIEKVQSEESKRRKTETSEETKNCERVTEVIANAGDDKHAGDESKSKNGSFSQFELQNTFIKQNEAPTNGNFEKDGAKSTAQKTKRKQQEGSAEPKTVSAFQRVKVDEVNFADERLQDNSYWAKGGAEVGYGAKAQEILGQVKGRDFRHEKTKKKRGSYRGGQIDLHTHSVKFNYSDED